MYASLFRPPPADALVGGSAPSASSALLSIAQEFSPRYERHRDDLVSVDVRGLERLLGTQLAGGRARRRRTATGADSARGAIYLVARSRMADRGTRAAVIRADAAPRAAVDAARAARSRGGGAARRAQARRQPLDTCRG